MIERIWNGHRVATMVVSLVAIAAIVATGLVIAAGHGNSAVALASPSASVEPSLTASPSLDATPTDSASPTASPTDSGPTPLPAGWAYSDLDGVATKADLAHRLPLAVMIDDNTVARPQSGMSTASIVYQAFADGGEDRYMMVYQEGDATDIGPVRSARPYYVFWAAEYKAMFGHYGGDMSSLQVVIPQMAKNIYNMDDLNGGACPYHRIATRVGPHNAYTNSAALISCLPKLKYPTTYQKLPARPFVDEIPRDERPAAQTITVPYRTTTIGYQYDPTTDSYARSVDGSLQIDPANNQQVYAYNIVVMYQTYAMQPSLDHVRPVVGNIGSGSAVVFKEGKAITATWKKTTNAALTRFYDSKGKEIPLVRGEIFLQSVPPGTKVTY